MLFTVLDLFSRAIVRYLMLSSITPGMLTRMISHCLTRTHANANKILLFTVVYWLTDLYSFLAIKIYHWWTVHLLPKESYVRFKHRTGKQAEWIKGLLVFGKKSRNTDCVHSRWLFFLICSRSALVGYAGAEVAPAVY